MELTDAAIIKDLDNVELDDSYRIHGFYGTGYMTDLSTGCKTYFNIIKNPDKVVSVMGCGPNVIKKIFELPECTIYMPEKVNGDIGPDVNISFDGTETVIGKSGFGEWWSKYHAS